MKLSAIEYLLGVVVFNISSRIASTGSNTTFGSMIFETSEILDLISSNGISLLRPFNKLHSIFEWQESSGGVEMQSLQIG